MAIQNPVAIGASTSKLNRQELYVLEDKCAMATTGMGSLARVAGIVAIATALSKVLGLVRQLLIAASFGSGTDYSAFGVAYILPGFIFILLGGINGPFHSAMVSVLKKRQGADVAPIVETVSTLVGLVLAVLTLGLMVSADGLVQLLSPGSSPELLQLAATQLRIMAPLAYLSGAIGMGFGTLNAAEHYLLPALSPLISSLSVIFAILFFKDAGGIYVLAWGTVVGGMLQWLAQIPLQMKLGLGRFRWRLQWSRPEVRTVVGIMIPAVLSSGAVYINVNTDLVFASFLPGDRAIGNLAYAQLLYLTPLGILSNVILVPLMPLYSRLAIPSHWAEFRLRIRQGLLVATILILPAAMLIGVLARPIVQVVYERGKFTPEITLEVSALLSAYAIGMVFYLSRDILVRVFYALEDSRTPLLVSTCAIVFNAAFDYIGIQLIGAPGLPLSTAGVNIVAALALGTILQRRLGGLPWNRLLWDIGRLAGVTAIAGGLTFAAWSSSGTWLSAPGPLAIVVRASVAGTIGLLVYAFGALLLDIDEVEQLRRKGRGMFNG
ncbi:MAG: murein biosynthesis integral membrane protein MurJ [Cyanobacteria bacterium P01_F01_bin.33]